MSLDAAITRTTPHAVTEGGQRVGAEPRPSNQTVIDAIRAHHGELAEQLRVRTDAVLIAARAGDCAAARDGLHEFYRAELMPHIVAEEQALYGPASELDATRLLILGMRAEHRALVGLIADLALARQAFEVATTAASAQALFTVHLAKENDLLLPSLDTAGLDLAAILDGMHEILGHTRPAQADPVDDGACACGCGHDTAEDGAEPVSVPAQITAAPADSGLSADSATTTGDTPATGGSEELDVRALAHGQRHEIIFAKLDALAPGDSLVIVNDHDPKPLRYQTSALWPDRFEWTYREAGPRVWRVAITRAG